MNKRGTVITDTNNVNYSRLIVRGDSLHNQVILSNPWPSSIMYYKEDTNQVINRDFTGRSFYISINLRRYLNSTASDDTPVLKLKVPYVYWDKVGSKDTNITRYAVFESVPSTTNNDTTTLQNNYGSIWNLIATNPSNKPDSIIITRKMLPTGTNDITISGYLNFAGLLSPINNPSNINRNHKLKSIPLATGVKDFIDSLKIEVTYLDTNTAVAIDWVKFETPNARKINQGFYDENIAESVQNDLDYFSQSKYADNNIKPKRWIVHVEGSPVNWEAERHFRKIVGDVTTGAVGGSLASHWDEYLGNADKPKQTTKPTTKPTKKAKKYNKVECYTPTLQKK